MAEFSDYAWLTSDDGRAWLERIAADPRSELQQLAAMRRELPTKRARLAMEQATLRRRAAAKFGPLARHMFFTRTLLEQATDRSIARYKAQRLAAAPSASTYGDYCCGIGGDLLALADVRPTTGWDRSELACFLAEVNLAAAAPQHAAQSRVVHGQVEATSPTPDEAWHLDPDRRATGARSSQVERYEPGPELVDRWLTQQSDGAVKLAPAAVAPARWADEAELEWISSQGECRQQVAWFGSLAAAPGMRRATALQPIADDGAQTTIHAIVGEPHLSCPAADEPSAYLFDPDSAVLAAGLLGQLAADHGLETLGPGGAYLTGDKPIAHGLLSALAIDAWMPLRELLIARHLEARGVGRLEIKKRGIPIDPNRFRTRLKLRGSAEAVLVLTRIGKREVAIVAQRIGHGAERRPVQPVE